MKKFKQIITVAVLAVFMLGAYSVKAQKNNPFNDCGINHNKALNLVFNKIKKNKLSKLNRTGKRNFIINEVLDYYKISKSTKNKTNINNFFDEFVFPPKTSPTYPDIKRFPKSKQFMKYSNTIYNLTLKGDLKSLINIVSDINKNMNITKTDKKKLLEITSIAYNSLNYWQENHVLWLGLDPNLDSINNTNTYNSRVLGSIAGADVGGAIAGAFFGGIGAGPGAAGASIIAGCAALGNWLF